MKISEGSEALELAVERAQIFELGRFPKVGLLPPVITLRITPAEVATRQNLSRSLNCTGIAVFYVSTPDWVEVIWGIEIRNKNTIHGVGVRCGFRRIANFYQEFHTSLATLGRLSCYQAFSKRVSQHLEGLVRRNQRPRISSLD